MPNNSNQEPALVGSIVSNDYSIVRSDERPSKHYQAGRDATERILKVGRNDYSFCSFSPRKNSWNKSVIWSQNGDDCTKAEAAGWPKWETVSNQSCKKYSSPGDACVDDSTMACKRGWNEAEDGNAKRATGEGGDAVCHDDLDGRRQSNLNIHMTDKGSLSESSCWDRATDGTGKREIDGWPIWPGAMSKKTWQCNGHQNSTGIQSKGWTISEDGSAMQRKKGWNNSLDRREKRENNIDTFERDGRNVCRQSRSNDHVIEKGSLSSSASWDQAKYEILESENDGGWRRWSGAMSETNWRCISHQGREGSWNQSVGWTKSEDGSTMACKSGWNESGYTKEKRKNGCDALDYDGCDKWRQSSLSNIHMVDKGSLSNSASWDRAKDDNAERENDEWPRWSGAMPETTQHCTTDQNRKGFWNQSEGCTTSEDGSSMEFRSGWNEYGNGKEKRKTADGSDAFDHNGHNGWKPTSSSTHMVDRGSLSKSSSWDQVKDDDTKRENDGWAKLPGAMSKTIGQFPSHQKRNPGSQKETGDRNPDLVQSGDPWMQRDSTLPQKCDWNTPVSWNASKGGTLDRDHRKWDPVLDESGSDLWKEINPAAPPIAHGENPIRRKSKWSERCPPSSQNRECGWNQSWGRIKSEDGDSLKENNGRRIRDLDHSDNPWMDHRHTMLRKYDLKRSASWAKSGGDGFEAERIKLSAAPDFGDPNALKRNMNTFSPKICGKRPFRGRNRTPYHAYEHEHSQLNDAYKMGAGGISGYHGDSPPGRNRRGSRVQHQIVDAVQKHPDRDTDEIWDCRKARCLRNDRISFEDLWKQRDQLQDIAPWRHRSRDDGAERNKSFQNTTPKQDLDQNVIDSPHALKSKQKAHSCQRSTQILGSQANNQTDHTSNSPIQFGQNIQPSPRHPSKTKNSNPNGRRQLPTSNPDDEVWNHQQQAMLNIPGCSTTKSRTISVSTSDPVFSQANEEDPSSNNLCSKLSPAIIEQKASMNPEEVKKSSKKLAPVAPNDKILNTDARLVKPETKQTSRICDFSSKTRNICHSEAVDAQVNEQNNSSKNEKDEVGANEELKDSSMGNKGIKKFKFALTEFVKEILKPVWKEGRLSKEAHKTVVKKVVEKVVGVLGTNIPQTQERIDLYLSYSKDKLHKLVQDYLEMFINT